MTKTIATSEAAIPGKLTVLKGLIGHSNSPGDQAPWDWNGENYIPRVRKDSRGYQFCILRGQSRNSGKLFF